MCTIMDVYAKAKYNKLAKLFYVMNQAFILNKQYILNRNRRVQYFGTNMRDGYG